MPLIDPYDHDDSTPPPPFWFSMGFAVGMAVVLICLIILT